MVGVYSTNNNVFDIFTMFFFGIAGYLMNKFGFEPAPFVMGMILSSLFENSFRQSLVLSDGSLGIFFSRPLSAVLMTVGLLVLASHLLTWFRKLMATSPE
jgi:putative tricarboxylic transport membrane protein